jgi:starch phosphorylase
MPAQTFNLEVTPQLPEALTRLEELANNLWYSWNPSARALFERLDKELWIRVGHNPKLFLRNIDQPLLAKAAQNPQFLTAYQQLLTNYDAYHQNQQRQNGGAHLAADDLIAYFCAEYGFHESLPVYSGGLGILAGDHCKTASDLRLPFIAVGLFYRQGYFTQHIDVEGNQHARYNLNEPQHLPMKVATDPTGAELHLTVQIANTQVIIKAWQLQIGHITLYLLDADVPQNAPDDRTITSQLYGGDQHTRIKQEMILGIGGVRMLRKLGLAPTVWHINEGHAAFSIMERLRERIAKGQPFDQAFETIAADTVFTTHTAVPAGHDHFPPDLIMNYLGWMSHELKLSRDEFLLLGRLPNDSPDFNMTTLAVKGTRHINGVSRIHGQVSAKICERFWPEITPAENPVGYITNGAHVPSLLARNWSDLFDQFLGNDWSKHLCDEVFWKRLEEIPDPLFWQVKQVVKSRMLLVLRDALSSQHLHNQISETHLERLLRYIDPNNPNILTIGFARRFATYKRATLLLSDRQQLSKILGDSQKPVLFLFAGKAHPADEPGKNLLKAIYRLSMEPDYMGRILVVEGYDLGLSRRLVSGVDVWLNNPVYPEEASGTSGMKAAFNGGINLSVLDGWWDESYDGDNGWAIKPSPHHHTDLRDREDARTLHEILQDQVIPLYYNKGEYGYSPGWVKKAKRSMATILPHFNTERMLNDYLNRIYLPAIQQGKRLRTDNAAPAQELTQWKKHISTKWGGVQIRQVELPAQPVSYGDSLTIKVAVRLNQLQPTDVTVELLLSPKVYHPEILVASQIGKTDRQKLGQDDYPSLVSYKFEPEGALPNSDEHLYRLTFKPDFCGGVSYQIRIFPFHKSLTNVHEMGMMRWV